MKIQLLFLLISSLSFSQDLEKGCGYSNTFFVKEQLASNPSSYSYLTGAMGLSHVFSGNTDTLFVPINDSMIYHFSWDLRNLENIEPYSLEENTAHWFKNDIEMNPLLTIDTFSFATQIGSCPSWGLAKSIFITQEPGTYHLKYIGNTWTRLRPIVLYRKLEEDSTEVIIQEEDAQEVTIFPNPVCNSLRINHYKELFGIVTIYNSQGNLIKEWSTDDTSNFTEFDVSQLENGIYFIHIKSSEQVIFKSRFFKN